MSTISVEDTTAVTVLSGLHVVTNIDAFIVSSLVTRFLIVGKCRMSVVGQGIDRVMVDMKVARIVMVMGIAMRKQEQKTERNRIYKNIENDVNSHIVVNYSLIPLQAI